MGIHHWVLVVHISSEGVDNMVDGKAQLQFAVIFGAREQQFSMPLDEDLAWPIDHDLADLRVHKEFIHRSSVGCVLVDLIQEWLLIWPKVAVRDFVRLKDQASQ